MPPLLKIRIVCLMEEKSLKNVTDLLNEPLWNTHTMLFRGVSDASYELKPSVGRLNIIDDNKLRKFEEDSLKEFKRRAIPFLKTTPETDIEWLYLAQHYGLPTRLLDWTTNSLVALYFASLNSHTNTSFAVYKYIQPKWLGGEFDPFEIEQIYGLRPPHHDSRYVNQDCAFTIHPAPETPLEAEAITKYTFEESTRKTIQWQLFKFGIKHSYIYPNLDGIAKDVLLDLNTQLNNGSVSTSGALFPY